VILSIRLLVEYVPFYGTFPLLQWAVTACFMLWVLQVLSYQFTHKQLWQVWGDTKWGQKQRHQALGLGWWGLSMAMLGGNYVHILTM